MKYYIIDNNDSFVYNLVAYFQKLGHEIIIENIEEININKIKMDGVHGIIISPGPGTPEQAKISKHFVNTYMGKIPILGVCLGHQVIAHCVGAVVKKGKRPMHGKVSTICNSGSRLFNNLPSIFKVTRYHSLIIDPTTLSKDIIIDAIADDGAIMAISHKYYPLYGLQFHPEALLTEYGYELLTNFDELCENWGV